MPIPTIDGELYSEAGFVWNAPSDRKPLGHWTALPGARVKGLGAVGSAAYSEHPSTELLTMSYDLCDGRGVRRWRPGQPLPLDLFAHIEAGLPLESHNAMFERNWWTNVAVPRYGFPPLPPRLQRCSMATAHVDQYPGALEALGDVLRLNTRKDKEGKALIKRFCIPRDPTKGDPRTRIRPEDDPAGFERLCEYCDQDVRSEMAAADAMAPMTDAELGFWLIDQEVNSRGLAIDRDGVRDCIAVLGEVLERYGAECRAITGGIGPSQVEALRGWLTARGVPLASLDADAVAEALTRDAVMGDERRVLELRAATGSASVKKLYAIENQCSADNRLRNLIVHHGARTGRPTGEGPQPLNLPKAGPKLVECACGRPHRRERTTCPWCGAVCPPPPRRGAWKPEYVDHVLEIMATRSLDMVEAFFGDAMLCISGCVRGLFVAGEGCELIASDYSAIEAVVAAMLAGEQWRIDAFRNNEPIYLVGASKITGVPLAGYLAYREQHGEHHVDRQRIGKVSELACLGPDTLVWSTDNVRNPRRARWRKLVDITTAHKVHDGTQWVGHGGLVSRGEREVSRRAGIVATADHEFLVGRTWTPFCEVDWPRATAVSIMALFCPHVDLPTDVPPERMDVYDLLDCGRRNRFLVASTHGPVVAHNCGFGGWIGSYKAFGSTDPDDVIKAQILAWRAASPAIVEMWGGQWRGRPWDRDRRRELYGLEGMAVAAIQSPGVSYSYRGITFQVVGTPAPTEKRWDALLEDWYEVPVGRSTQRLMLTLPSGRQLTYHEPMLTPGAGYSGDEFQISYATQNSNPKYGALGWVRMTTYGGRLFENVVQAVAHDIQRHGIILLRLHGYPLVLGVYDEDVVEVPAGTGSVEEVERLMSTMPAWANGWPIRASGGWRGARYRKG